jgi:hypothetical protein
MTGLRAEAIALDCRTSRNGADGPAIARSGYPGPHGRNSFGPDSHTGKVAEPVKAD